jgi:hypothetical protein
MNDVPHLETVHDDLESHRQFAQQVAFDWEGLSD